MACDVTQRHFLIGDELPGKQKLSLVYIFCEGFVHFALKQKRGVFPGQVHLIADGLQGDFVPKVFLDIPQNPKHMLVGRVEGRAVQQLQKNIV